MSKSKKVKTKIAPHNKISRLEFCATHFDGEQFPSYMFYVGVANKIYPTIQKVFSAQPDFTNDVSRRMAIILACYVEDLVAGSGVWAAFTSYCTRKNTGTASHSTISESSLQSYHITMNFHRFIQCCFYFGT